jgi:hypothetical protein
VIAVGHYPAFQCLIMPFADRLDIKIPWLFYQVPNTNPGGINTVFTDRFWDDREHWIPPSIGVVPGSLAPYFGPLPPSDMPMSPVVGTPDQWLHGLSYAAWQANEYAGAPCWPINDFLMQENRRLLLQENTTDGGRIIITDSLSGDFLLQENAYRILQENGNRIILNQ